MCPGLHGGAQASHRDTLGEQENDLSNADLLLANDAGCPAYAQLKQVPQWPGTLYMGIVNHHCTLFLGAMQEASSAPACLQAFKDLHMFRMNRAPGESGPSIRFISG